MNFWKKDSTFCISFVGFGVILLISFKGVTTLFVIRLSTSEVVSLFVGTEISFVVSSLTSKKFSEGLNSFCVTIGSMFTVSTLFSI